MTWRNDLAKRTITPLLVGAAIGRVILRGRTILSRLAWVLGVLRLGLLFIDVRRGVLPWQRMLLPTLLVLQWTLIEGGWADRMLVHLPLAALELLLLVLVVSNLRESMPGQWPEQRVAAKLALFVPERAGRWIATELVVLSSSVMGFFRERRLREGEFSYVENSILLYLPLAFLLEAPVEYLLVSRAFGVTNLWWHIGLMALNAYGLFWFMGVLATMRQRPHAVIGGTLRARLGILATAEVPLADISSARVLETVEAPRAERLTLPGASAVSLELKQPVRIARLFGRDALTTRLCLSADDAVGLCRAIEQNAALAK